MDSKVCRTCGEDKGQYNIFSENQNLKICVRLVYCCAAINITEGDGLPAHICCKCEEELSRTYQFILKCEATDRRLRSTIAPDTEDSKPKVEVKQEEYSTDFYNHNEDTVDDYAITSSNKEEIKLENHETKNKVKINKKSKYIKTAKSNKCPICKHKSASPSALVIHMRNHSGEKPFQCPSCEKSYKDKGNLKRHINIYHCVQKRSRDFICEHCGKSFFRKTDVKIHMRTHTGETPYVCPQCPAKFTQVGALIRHKKRHTDEKPHICAICGKTFRTKEEVKYHSRVHSDEKNYSCTICNLPFKYKNNLRKHMVLHYAPNSFVCNYCGRTFSQKGNLKMHIKRQHSEKSGTCDICMKNVSNVEAHMWRHTGHRPFKCEYCASTYFDMKQLARHVNYRHKHPDKFECTFEGCGMKFPAKNMLEFHTAKLHETGIPFPCDKCNRGFYRKNDLARHKIGTHKERLT